MTEKKRPSHNIVKDAPVPLKFMLGQCVSESTEDRQRSQHQLPRRVIIYYYHFILFDL